VIEVQVGLTAAVIWGFAHALQYSALRYNRLVVEDWGYQICNGVRIATMVITAACFLIWICTYVAALLRIVCSM
jgi:hypothetical protein